MKQQLPLVLALLALAGCAYEMNPDQMRRAYRACDDAHGLAYVSVDGSADSGKEVRAQCRDGSRAHIPAVRR